MTEEKEKKKSGLFDRLKDIYDTYKIIVWILPFFGAGLFDRFYNMWGLPDKVEQYKEQFVAQRSADSAKFVEEITNLRLEIQALKGKHTKSKLQ